MLTKYKIEIRETRTSDYSIIVEASDYESAKTIAQFIYLDSYHPVDIFVDEEILSVSLVEEEDEPG